MTRYLTARRVGRALRWTAAALVVGVWLARLVRPTPPTDRDANLGVPAPSASGGDPA